MIGTVSSTFLGLTLRCARCHNHKYEALSQMDYARMTAIFEPLKRPQKDRSDLDVLVGSRTELAAYHAAMQRHEAAVKILNEQIAALDQHVRQRFLAEGKTKLSPEVLAAHKTEAEKRDSTQKELVKKTLQKFKKELRASRTTEEQRQRDVFRTSLGALEAAKPTSPPRAYIWQEPTENIPVTQVFYRGDPTSPAGAVQPGFPAVLRNAKIDFLKSDSPEQTTLRRLSLAKWMTSAQNPLVSRVMVNRIWQGHFGEGIAASENDFGVMGLPPSHPELLDWLATQFRESGWSMKQMHRLIVLSNTYGQASTFRDEAAKIDAENELLWRFPLYRLEAEVLRDAVLAVSGKLNLQMGGPSVYPKIADEVLAGQSRPGSGWGQWDENASSRRAVYIFVKRSLLVPLLDLFDVADTTSSCEQRSRSTIPTQALTLLNGEFLNRQAGYFAQRLRDAADDDSAAWVTAAYRLALGREPDEKEFAASLAFLERQRELIKQESPEIEAAEVDRQSLQSFCLAIYNLNEFLYVD